MGGTSQEGIRWTDSQLPQERRKPNSIWLWLKMQQEGQTAGFGNHVSTCQGIGSGFLGDSHING